MNKLIYFLLGVLLAVVLTNRLYDRVTNTQGLSHFAGYAYILGCKEAKGQDCKLKSETYTNKLREIMGLIQNE